MALQMPSTTKTKILYLTKALYDAAPGNTYLGAFESYVAEGGMNNFANWLASSVSTDVATLKNTVIASLKLTGAVATAAGAYFDWAFGQNPNNKGQVILDAMTALANLTNDPTYGPSALAFNQSVSIAYQYSINSANGSLDLATLQAADEVTPATVAVTLTTGMDKLVGTSGAELFSAYIFDNQNTLQTGDTITGGAGTDILFAQIANSQKFAIGAFTSGVEHVQIQAEATPVDSTNGNNTSGELVNTVQIDAQNMSGVTTWESTNSRADVIIEDVRIADGAKTKDVTIVFAESDPGNVDFGVYFDQESLRNSGTSESKMNLRVLDTYNTKLGNDNLKDSPYGSFTFSFSTDGGTTYTAVTLASAAMGEAKTVAAMTTAMQAAADAQFGAGVVSVTAGPSYTVKDSVSGADVTANEILVTAQSAIKFSTTVAGSGWLATKTVPAISGLYTSFDSGATATLELVTSTIVLDDVGRGSMGGDLIVGGMSTGATSNSRGVERFEIEVRDNSKLQTIDSTNNALREVTIVNGVTNNTTNNSGVYDPTTENAGNLTVTGNANPTNAVQGQSAAGGGADTALPGSVTADHVSGYGFTDVRLIDASAMTGKLSFDAQITSDSIAKYINLTDTAANPLADVAGSGNVNYNVKGGNFIYTGGANNDTMVVDIDGAVVASRSTVVSGMSDFTFNINGGAGNDAITVDVVNSANTAMYGGLENWANNQDLNDNIKIDAGAGDDTIRIPGAGDTVIDAGSGNDTLYTDNTGKQTGFNFGTGSVIGGTPDKGVWVFNTIDQANAIANGAARNLADLRSSDNSFYKLYKGTLTVTFKGLTSAAIDLNNPTADTTINGTTISKKYMTSDLEINQAIKNAINSDATLSKLLVASDGPNNTLVVKSLIDGTMTTADLTVAVAKPVATTTFTAAELAGMATAYGVAVTDTATALAAMDTAITDYATQMAQDAAGVNIVGAASASTSDNFITPGTGDDVIVLGTTVGVDKARSSNEVVYLTAGFGTDVIVNYAATGMGVDHINVYAFLGKAPTVVSAIAGVASNAAGVINITAETTSNDTAAEIKTLADTAMGTTAQKQVYITFDATKTIGKVYSINKGAAANDAVVTLEGTVKLAGNDWSTLVLDNFAVYGSQAEGASSAVVGPVLTAVAAKQVLIGTANVDQFNTGGFADVVMTGLAANDVFTVTTGSTGAVITDLTTGDIVTVAGTGDVTANNVAAFVATYETANNGAAAADFTINSLAAGSIVNMSAATGTMGYTLVGGAGVDTLTGSAKADTITSAGGNDVISAGAGMDTINVSVGGTVSVTSGADNDTINIAAGTVTVTDLMTGDDLILTGGTVNATNVSLFVASANTTSNQVVASNVITSAAAGSTVNMTLAGCPWTLTGGAGVDTLTGSAQADVITGAAGADVIVDGAGIDNITGGAGADAITLTVDADADRVIYNAVGDAGAAGTLAASAGDAITGFVTTSDDLVFLGDFLFGSMTGTAADAVNAIGYAAGIDFNAGGSGDDTVQLVATGAATATAASLVVLANLNTAIGAIANETVGDERILAFAGGDGSTALYYFTSVTADGALAANELQLLGISSATIVAADIIFA